MNNLIKSSYVVSLITLITGLVASFILPPEIPLFYGLPQTSDQLASSLYLPIPAILSIIITTINTILSSKIENDYLKKTLTLASISVSILATIATVKIIFLVGSF